MKDLRITCRCASNWGERLRVEDAMREVTTGPYRSNASSQACIEAHRKTTVAVAPRPHRTACNLPQTRISSRLFGPAFCGGISVKSLFVGKMAMSVKGQLEARRLPRPNASPFRRSRR
jgi:hypothetical protein